MVGIVYPTAEPCLNTWLKLVNPGTEPYLNFWADGNIHHVSFMFSHLETPYLRSELHIQR